MPDVKPTVPVAGAVAAVAFDPGARRIAVGGYKSAHLMALAGSQWTGTLAGHADLVRALAFSPDGQPPRVAGGPSGRFGEIKIWDVQACRPETASSPSRAIPTRSSPSRSHLTASTIASAGYDKFIKLWDVATGKLVTTLKEHRTPSTRSPSCPAAGTSCPRPATGR